MNRSIYSIEATSKCCLKLFIDTSGLILLRKGKNDAAIPRNMLFTDPVWDSFPFYMRTVQSQTGTKIPPVGSATDTKSDRSEFVFGPVPCKRMKINVWRAIRTYTGPSSSRLYSSLYKSHICTLQRIGFNFVPAGRITAVWSVTFELDWPHPFPLSSSFF